MGRSLPTEGPLAGDKIPNAGRSIGKAWSQGIEQGMGKVTPSGVPTTMPMMNSAPQSVAVTVNLSTREFSS